MTGEPSIWQELWRAAATNATLAAVAWGGAGGLTSALAIQGQSRRAVVRQVTMGALVSGGLGTAGGGILWAWLGLPPEAIPVTTAAGAVNYLTGVFGPAVFEVVLRRIRSGRLPPEGPGDAP